MRSDTAALLISVGPLSLVHGWEFTRENLLGPDWQAWNEGKVRPEAIQNVLRRTPSTNSFGNIYSPPPMPSNLLRTCSLFFRIKLLLNVIAWNLWFTDFHDIARISKLIINHNKGLACKETWVEVSTLFNNACHWIYKYTKNCSPICCFIIHSLFAG